MIEFLNLKKKKEEGKKKEKVPNPLNFFNIHIFKN